MKKAIMMATVVLMVVTVMAQAQFVSEPKAPVTNVVFQVRVVKPIPVAKTAAVTKDQFPNIKLGLYTGYAFGEDFDKGSVVIGASVDYILNKNFLLEATISQLQTDQDDLNIALVQSAFTIQLRAPLSSRVSVSGGIGASYSIFDAQLGMPGFDVDIESAVGLLVAAGLEIPMYDRFGFSLKGKYNAIKTNALVKGPRSQELVKGTLNFFEADAGFYIKF